MKKNYALLIILLIISSTAYTQHISEYYTFKHYNQGGYSYLYDGDIIMHNADSDGSEIKNVSIGFDFEYAGTTYTHLCIGMNGAITFTGDDVFGGNKLDGTAENVTDIIAVLWDDLYFRSADGAEIRTKLSGTAPYRKFSIEWYNLSWWHQGSTVTFRLELFEKTNDIEMYYTGVDVEETGGEIGASIGLNAGTSGDNFISISPGINFPYISSEIANNSIMPSQFNEIIKFQRLIFEYGPKNDRCQNAIEITNFDDYSNTQIMNGTDNNDGFINVGTSGMNDGVWYTFTAPVTGEINIEAITPEFDAEIGVYSGNCGDFDYVGSKDANNGSTENLRLNVIEGTEYWINIGHYSSATDEQETGNLTLNLHYSPPVNDLCTNAIEINCGDTIEGTTIGANAFSTTTCSLNSDNKGVWYHFSAQNGGGITSIWTTPDFNSKLTVFKGACNSLQCIASIDDTTGDEAYMEIETLPDTDYYIFVTGASTETGKFSLDLTCTTPENDEAANAISIYVNTANSGCSNPTTVWNNNGATSSEEINGIPLCAEYQGGDLWYKFIAPSSGSVKLLRENKGNWGALGYAVYNAPDSIEPLVCEEIWETDTEGNPISGLTPSQTYFLRIWEYRNNDFGSVNICLEEIVSSNIKDLNKLGFKYYPNPVENILYLSANNKIKEVHIYSLTGQKIKSHYPELNKPEINIADLAGGVYIVKVLIGSHTGTISLIKK